MRLIDADDFEAYIKEHCKDTLVDLWCELVRRQPTVDTEGVDKAYLELVKENMELKRQLAAVMEAKDEQADN